MTDLDETLRTTLQQALEVREQGRVPDFASTWAAAENTVRAHRKRRGVFAGGVLAAAAMVAVLAISLLPSRDGGVRYIDANELLETTRWSAPSDSLLPEREFDMYREFPALIESTETHGGALL